MTRAGFIGLAGRPNVGKSTLVNAIVGSHVVIVSTRPQTTRRAIRGIATDTGAGRQLVMVDLPGVQKPRDVLTERMQHRVERELSESDLALVVINGEEGVGPGDPDATGLGESYLAGQTGTSIFWGNFFCSQLVTDTYMHMGLVEMDDFPPNGYSPAAFGIDDPSTVGLRLVPPAKLGDTFFAEWDGPSGGGVDCDQNRQT